MLDKLKIPFIVTLSLSLTLWIGYSTLRYFTYQDKPIVSMKGLNQDDSYKGLLECAVTANNDYKIGEIELYLDGKKLEISASKRVKSKRFELPFTIDTTTLQDEKHVLEVEAVDTSYHRNKAQFKWEFYIDNIPLRAAFIESAYKVDQGKTLHIKIQSNKKLKKAAITFISATYNCHQDMPNSTVYECFIPIDCEQNPSEHTVSADLEDAVKNSIKMTTKAEVAAYQFKKQRSDIKINSQKFDQEKEISISTKILDEAIQKWTQDSPKEKLWSGPFEFPIHVRQMTTPFGEVRMTAERGRYMHKGLDLIDLPKSVVWASQHGKVVIKDRFQITGNTIVIDHGLGVCTLYAHLDTFAEIEVGDMIKKGNPIGRIGMTGYSTGYHLHWELRVNGVAVDPLEWTNKVY